MLAKVDYIKTIFKITGDNPYVISDIADKMAMVQDFGNFRMWLDTNINHYDAKYLNGFPKFAFLIKLYTRQYVEQPIKSGV